MSAVTEMSMCVSYGDAETYATLQRFLNLVKPRDLVHHPLPLLSVRISRIWSPAVCTRLSVSPLVRHNVLGAVDTALAEAPFSDGQLDLEGGGLLVLAGLPEFVHLHACLPHVSLCKIGHGQGSSLPSGRGWQRL
jgi:hypothetical protein